MLRVYLRDSDLGNAKVISDVEKQFSRLRLACTSKEKEIVKEIEQGELLDSDSFIDRFGHKLRLSALSTGCKAALCVLNCTNKVIDLTECGLRCRDLIITLCDKGSILITTNSLTISWELGQMPTVDIRVNDYHFTDIVLLNRYIFNEYPYKAPDLNATGVQLVTE